MQYYPEIVPLFDAYIYLCERFTNYRTAERIEYYRSRLTSDPRWAYYERIIELQNYLDEQIEVDELFKRYFSPLKTKEALSERRPITLGGMLLYPFPGMEYPFSFDRLVEHCKNAPQHELLECYYGCTLAPFFNDSCELSELNMSTVISSVNSILVEAEDKWAVIDCISNPIEHLEKLRPLTMRAISLISEKAVELSDFIAQEMGRFCAADRVYRNLDEIMNTKTKAKDFSDAKLFASLLSFNGVDLSYKLESLEFNRAILGIGLNMVVERRKARENDDAYIKLLKMLSDQNRFRILHELCNKESYGQELADKFGGARSGIYYHLEKLLGYGLLNVNMTEYRTLYTMNKQNVYDQLTALRDFLVDGWKPEDAE